jgi:hypothetical protein
MEELLQAIGTINNHAKVAKSLYFYKKEAIVKLLQEKKAKKIGIQKLAPQKIYVVIKADDYIFHLPATSSDMKTLPTIPYNPHVSNPKQYMSIKDAKSVVEQYIGKSASNEKNRNNGVNRNNFKTQQHQKRGKRNFMISSYLDGNSKW